MLSHDPLLADTDNVSIPQRAHEAVAVIGEYYASGAAFTTHLRRREFASHRQALIDQVRVML